MQNSNYRPYAGNRNTTNQDVTQSRNRITNRISIAQEESQAHLQLSLQALQANQPDEYMLIQQQREEIIRLANEARASAIGLQDYEERAVDQLRGVR